MNFLFRVPALARAVAEHHVLQFALAAFIAYRAIQRMVGEEEFERGLAGLGQVADRALQLVRAHGSSIQFDFIILIDTYDRVFQFSGQLLRSLGFRQINLHLWLIFLKRR